MKKNHIYHAIIAVGVLSAGFLFWYLVAPRGGDEQFTVDELRRMLREGETDEIRALGAGGLGEHRDAQSVPLLLDAMEDESQMVRGQAGVAVTKILGADFYFDPADPPEERKEIVDKYRRLWEVWKKKNDYTSGAVSPESPSVEGAGT